jgi:hypothetical protein
MKIAGQFADAEEIVLKGNSRNDLPAAYYISKRRQLEYKLDQLNVMDHPLEIQRLCGEIVTIKKKLEQLAAQKRNS